MYSRTIDERTYTFEPSGGLLHAALVMMDRETDSHWSILRHAAIWGPARGEALRELPGAVKRPWGEWRRDHPDTLVLSVDGKEHEPHDPYERYFTSERGFRGLATADRRLPDKALIYAFRFRGRPVAVPHTAFAAGSAFPLGEAQLFLYREAGDSHFRSTAAYLAPEGSRFVQADGGWRLEPGGWRWNRRERGFEGGEGAPPRPRAGFDTYWYSWSLTNEGTELLPGPP